MVICPLMNLSIGRLWLLTTPTFDFSVLDAGQIPTYRYGRAMLQTRRRRRPRRRLRQDVTIGSATTAVSARTISNASITERNVCIESSVVRAGLLSNRDRPDLAGRNPFVLHSNS